MAAIIERLRTDASERAGMKEKSPKKKYGRNGMDVVMNGIMRGIIDLPTQKPSLESSPSVLHSHINRKKRRQKASSILLETVIFFLA